MDVLINYESLLFLIAAFLLIVVLLPFIFREIKKKKNAQKLINRIVPVFNLSDSDVERIETLHPDGKKRHPAINTSICVGCGTCVLSCQEKDTLYLINGKSALVNPFACKSHGDCERQCPTGALQLVEYGKRMKVHIPEVDDHFQSSVKGIYIVGVLSGAGLIKEAINQGRAAVNHIMRDVYPDNLPNVVVVGAGPAGLSAFLSCRKFGLPSLCLEKENTANTIRNFPKKKILMAEPVDMPIYGPLWVGDTTREKLLEAWERILEKTGVDITIGSQLEHIRGSDGNFIVTASGQEYSCQKVILALGNRGVPRKLKVSGEDGDNVFYNLLDAKEFSGTSVTISGAGDSAVEAALSLMQQQCRINIVLRGDGFPRVKAKNREKIVQAIENKNITAFYNSRVAAIDSNTISIEDSLSGQSHNLPNDHVFVMIGGELPFQLLEKIGISVIEKEV
jgi:thioredoxin reductase/NAD-dependent dihydropyrimidine dehydrogenase PreA subunit